MRDAAVRGCDLRPRDVDALSPRSDAGRRVEHPRVGVEGHGHQRADTLPEWAHIRYDPVRATDVVDEVEFPERCYVGHA